MPRLVDFTSPAMLTSALASAGLGEAAAARHADAFAAVAGVLHADAARDRPAAAYFVPGRIEVLGKHTDYAGGDSLVCAVELGFCVVAVPDRAPAVHVTDAVSGAARTYWLDALPDRDSGWGRYPLAVLQRIVANFGMPGGGARLAFVSTLPPAAGLSSSSAFVVAAFLALRDVWGVGDDPRYRGTLATPVELADYLGHVENGQTYRTLAGARGVGTFGGSQDHTAILCSRAGAIARFGYAPTRGRGVAPMPEGWTFAVALSGVEADKGGAARDAYNAASRLAADAVARWNVRHGSSLQRMRDLPAAVDDVERVLGDAPDLLSRYRHFHAENDEIVPAAFAAVERADWAAFGALAGRSQALAETLLGNQVPETAALARMATEEGAWAASAFGAGFGGAVWALIRASEAEAFIPAWMARYRAAFPERTGAAAFATRPGPSAFALLQRQENESRG